MIFTTVQVFKENLADDDVNFGGTPLLQKEAEQEAGDEGRSILKRRGNCPTAAVIAQRLSAEAKVNQLRTPINAPTT